MNSRLFSPRQVLILASLWLTFLLSFVVRLSWSSLMPIINDALHFTAQQGAAYVSAFYLGYAITVLPGGLFADRFGYRKGILFSLFAMAIVTALMSTITSYEYGLVIRFLLGVVSGPVQSACLSAIGSNFTDKQRGTATGIFMSCTSFGISTVNLYAPWVATQFGWERAFLVTAILPLLVLVLSFFSLRGKPLNQVVTESTPASPLGIIESLKHIMSSRNIILLAIAGFFATGTTWGVSNWTNLYMVKSLGVTAIFAGGIMSLYGMAAWIAKPIIGFISDVLPVRKNFTAAFVMFLFAPALIIFASTTDPNMLFITGPILGVGAFMHSAVTNALVIQSAEPNLRATTAGFVNLFNQIGALLAPLMLGKVLAMTGSYQDSFFFIAIAPIIGAIALLFIRLKSK